jgi:hypothetical protein
LYDRWVQGNKVKGCVTAIPRLPAPDEDRLLDAGRELRNGNALLRGGIGPAIAIEAAGLIPRPL